MVAVVRFSVGAVWERRQDQDRVCWGHWLRMCAWVWLIRSRIATPAARSKRHVVADPIGSAHVVLTLFLVHSVRYARGHTRCERCHA